MDEKQVRAFVAIQDELIARATDIVGNRGAWTVKDECRAIDGFKKLRIEGDEVILHHPVVRSEGGYFAMEDGPGYRFPARLLWAPEGEVEQWRALQP